MPSIYSLRKKTDIKSSGIITRRKKPLIFLVLAFLVIWIDIPSSYSSIIQALFWNIFNLKAEYVIPVINHRPLILFVLALIYFYNGSLKDNIKSLYRNKKYILYLIIVMLVFYPEYLKRQIYPYIYGEPTDEKLVISEEGFFEDIENAENIIYKAGKYTATLMPVTKHSITALVAFSDKYMGIMRKFNYRKREHVLLYDAIAPSDLFLFFGSKAKPGILEKCKIKHEYRGANFFCPDDRKMDDNNNYHIIPANDNIRKALELIMKGDIIHIEGILVNVVSDDVAGFKLHTGSRFTQIHKNQFMGGNYTGMCFVTYTTKIILNNRVYQ